MAAVRIKPLNLELLEDNLETLISCNITSFYFEVH